MAERQRKIFISHTGSEREIALALQGRLQADFGQAVEVFVSSDLVSIKAGEIWLNAVEKALREAMVVIVVCSPASVSRSWVQFEAGGGWVRKIPVVPFCHSGITPKKLPTPFNLLHAVVATRPEGFKSLYASLSDTLAIKKPEADFATIVVTMKRLEKKLARVTRAPPVLPRSMQELYTRMKARRDPDIRLHTFLGQDPKPVALDGDASPVDVTNVMRLWADAAFGNSIQATLCQSDDRRVIRVRFTNHKGSVPGDVTIRPLGFRAVAVARRQRYLTIGLRAPRSGECNDGREPELAVAFRLIDGQATQWAYGNRDMRQMFKIPVADTWTSLALDLRGNWELFESDGNYHYASDKPRFNVISAVVIEVGTPGGTRPGAGTGELEVSAMRLCTALPTGERDPPC